MKHTKYVVMAALVAAIYIVLTYFSAVMGLASNAIQVRFSEVLSVLPYFTAAAVPGLFVGCILSNIMTGCAIWDVVFGSFATLLGAYFTHKLRNCNKFWAPVPPILANTLILPVVLKLIYQFPGSMGYFVLTVFVGEFVSCGILGMLLIKYLEPHKRIFK